MAMVIKVLICSFLIHAYCYGVDLKNTRRYPHREYFAHPYGPLILGNGYGEHIIQKIGGIGNIAQVDGAEFFETTLQTTSVEADPLDQREDKCRPYNCSSSNECTTRELQGCLQLPFQDATDDFTYHIMLPVPKSVIRLLIHQNMSFPDPGSRSTVELVDNEYSGITDTIHLGSSNSSETHSFVSKGSDLTVRIHADGGWQNRAIRLEYEAIEFETVVQTFHNDSGEIVLEEGGYRPNRDTIFKLVPDSRNGSSILVTLWYLDIDEEKGEFVLIGAGEEPFQGPPAMFVTGRKTTPKKYRVASDYGYVAFAARSSNRKSHRFRLTWIRNGTAIVDPKETTDDPISDSVLQSVPVCIYNYTYVQEFYDAKNKEDVFPLLREKLAQIANDYTREIGMHLSTPVRNTSVRLIRISSVHSPDPDDPDMSAGLISTLVTIVRRFDASKAVFRRPQLQQIVDRLDKYDSDNGHVLLGTKVGRCPSAVNYSSWKMGVYVLLPLLAILFLAIWVSKYTSLWKTRRFSSGRKKFRSDLVCYSQDVSLENEYGPGPEKPKIRLTTEEGRNYSVDSANSYSRVTPLSDDDSDIEIFNKLRKFPRRRSDLPESMRGGNPTPEPQMPPVFESREEGDRHRLWQHSNVVKMMGTQKTEHLYDSLESTMNIDQFEYTTVTKL